MNPIQTVCAFISEVFSADMVTLDEPLVEGGVWAMNAFQDGCHLAVAWQEGKGFGIVSNDRHCYGEGAEEVYDDIMRLLPRAIKLLLGGRITSSHPHPAGQP